MTEPTTPAPVAPALLTVRETAKALRLSESAVYRALSDRDLPGYKIRGRWRISRTELHVWIKSQGPNMLPADPDPMPRPRQPAVRFRDRVREEQVTSK